MAKPNTKSSENGKELYNELAELPGTKEVIELFDRYNRTVENLGPYQELFQTQYITATSNSSNSVFE
ncbi:hypothetical protein KJ966_24665 [bacterium]|nr:hypothetical protein [bacterium]